MVSVIIPTHRGAEKQTQACVDSVKASTYKDIEIILVNEGLERSAQRNIGIARAHGEHFLFLDSDQTVSPCLIAECRTLMWHYDALYIPERVATPGWFGHLRNWERQFYTGTAVDVVRFVQRSVCPEFDLTMSGPEDSDFDRRVKGRRGITMAWVNHYDNVGVIQYLKKKAYYTKSMARFAEKWPGDKCLNFWYRCFGIYLEDGKWKRLVRRPDLAVAMYIMVLIRGLIYLCGTLNLRARRFC